MKNTFAALAIVGSALAKPMPQAVTSAIAPEASAPAGCESSTDGEFQITVVNVTSSASKRDLERRQQDGTLECKLADGTLTDQAGRTGYIASNYQFQFDGPPQAGAIYTSGFSLCSNNSLSLGGSSVFYQCYSGDFYNLYDRHWADQCSPVYLVAVNKGGSSASASVPAASQLPDGQPGISSQASAYPTSAPAPLSEKSDGQPQVPTAPAPAVTQIGDGQIQVPTAASTPAAVVSQISDGQPQAPTAAPPASSPAAVVSQISDGQPQGPTAAPAPSSAAPVISQISDGQPQVPTEVPEATSAPPAGTPSVPPAPPVSQISDGQIQVPTDVAAPTGGNFSANATASAPLGQFTGAASLPVAQLGSIMAAVAGVFAFL